MNETQENLIYLLYCAVNGITPDKARVQTMDLENLYKQAKFHKVRAAVCIALERAGVQHEDFHESKIKAIRKNIYLDMEKAAITAELENLGIWYMPLKGSILKDLYPENGMREMSDIDILFDEQFAEKVREIFEEKGYTTTEFGDGHHDTYQKEPILSFEMHTHLFGKGHSEVFNAYYDDTMRLMLHDEDNNFGYHFSDEDFYVFMTAHEYKHYSDCGTGIRSLLDCYVFVKNKGDMLDWDYITEQCRQLEISEFEQERRQLAMKTFSSDKLPKLSESEQEMLTYYLMAGAYGSMDSMISSRIKKTGSKGLLGKIKYVWNRLFPPIENMRQFYPEFFENKLLLPLLPFYRLSRIFTVQKDFVKSELKALFKYKGNF